MDSFPRKKHVFFTQLQFFCKYCTTYFHKALFYEYCNIFIIFIHFNFDFFDSILLCFFSKKLNCFCSNPLIPFFLFHNDMHPADCICLFNISDFSSIEMIFIKNITIEIILIQPPFLIKWFPFFCIKWKRSTICFIE